MKLRKKLALVIVLVMLVATFGGCSKKVDDTKGNSNSTVDTTTTEENASADDEIVTLKWIQVGNGMPSNYEAWQEKINKYLGEKIGVNIDVEVVSWGDWDNRRSVIINSGEYFDILFTDFGRYNSEVNLGSYLDITDMIKTSAPDLYSYIPEDYWKAVSIKDKIYGVPTYKDSSATQYFVWDQAIIDKYSVDADNLLTFADLTDTLTTIKDGEGTAPFILDKSGADVILSIYDQMGAGLPALGVKYDDNTYTAVSTLEEEEILSQLDVLHQWYKEGIINADAPTLDEKPAYRMLFTAQGWSSAAQTTWGPQMGVEAKAVKFIDTIVSNTTVCGSLNSIYSGTKYPEKCLEFLQLINTDSVVRDAFYYGLEGENFEYTDANKINKLNTDWSMAGYTQGTFFNVTQLAEEKINQWDEVKELNANANPSVLLGFTLDTSKIESELANCRAVYEKYKSELFTGAKEPRELVKTIRAELDAAGYEKVLAETQAQLDAMYK